MNVTVTWPKVAAIVVPVVVTIGLGYWALIDRVIDGISDSVAHLSASTSERFSGREEEDRDIRNVIVNSNKDLREELAGLSQGLGQLGDRIVASNIEVGAKIDVLRDSMVSAMEKRDVRLDNRFDRLEHKIDDMMKKISFGVQDFGKGSLEAPVDVRSQGEQAPVPSISPAGN